MSSLTPPAEDPSLSDACLSTEGGTDKSTKDAIDDSVLPLVHPASVPKKKNRDPNKGLYPKKKRVSKASYSGASGPLPAFSKASEIYKGNRLNMSSSDSNRLHKISFTSRLNDVQSSVPCPGFQLASHSFASGSASLSVYVNNEIFLGSDNMGAVVGPSHDSVSESEQKRKKRKIVKEDAPNSTLHNFYKTLVNKTDASQSRDNKGDVITVETSVSHTNEKVKVTDIQSDASSAAARKGACELTTSVSKDGSHYYGLFGATRKCEQEVQPNCFEWLPLSLMEQILCQIPFLDLLNLRLVCKNWNEIISNNKFMQWKKTYYTLKIKNKLSESFCTTGIDEQLRTCKVSDCFPLLIRFMGSFFSRRAPPNMLELLRTVPKCADAEKVVRERLPELSPENPNPWSIMAAMTLLSETVWDISVIFKHLLYMGSSCSLHDVLDAMYCIAAFLLHFKKWQRINHGLHYRVYYAIYMLENNIFRNSPGQDVQVQPGISGQQSMHAYCKPVEQRLTYEQIRILNHRVQRDQLVKIIAFAGTGKTSTLIHFARLYPQMRFLTVVFNKSTCEHASKCFPKNVECRTAHSLAYKAVGAKYRHKLSSKLKPHDIVSFLSKPKNSSLHIFTYAKFVLQTVEIFAVSSDERITIAHVPNGVVTTNTTIMGARATISKHLNDDDRLSICNEAAELWKKMVDREQKRYRITHDVYLKLYQLSRPNLSEYNCIMIDEAQDCNAAMLDIMLSQNLPVILVGDPNQQIYQFRGADNALDSVKATHTYHLTKSFRFGPAIAYVASCCIEVLKCNDQETLIGCEKESFVDGCVKGQYAVISRTNLKLFEEVVRLCCTDRRRAEEPGTIQAAFAGGIAGYGFDQIVDIYRLANNDEKEKITDRFVKKFSTFDDLQTYARKAEDSDLLGKIEMALTYGQDILHHMKVIKKKCSYPIELANVVFSTAHKAKGLEFDTVYLTRDYNVGGIPCEKPRIRSPLSEEFNILYVALTRAKQCLVMSEELYKVLLLSQEKFEYPVSSSQLIQDSVMQKCVNCSSEFTPHTALVLFRRSTTLASGRKIEGGPLCIKCATAPRFRPQVHRAPAILLLDFVEDSGHRSMSSLVGPLPSDPPIIYDDVIPERALQHFVFQVNIP